MQRGLRADNLHQYVESRSRKDELRRSVFPERKNTTIHLNTTILSDIVQILVTLSSLYSTLRREPCILPIRLNLKFSSPKTPNNLNPYSLRSRGDCLLRQSPRLPPDLLKPEAIPTLPFYKLAKTHALSEKCPPKRKTWGSEECAEDRGSESKSCGLHAKSPKSFGTPPACEHLWPVALHHSSR